VKIAVWYNVPSGGAKRALHDHVKGLAERGHTVEIWCPDTADVAYAPLSSYGPEHVLPLSWHPEDKAPSELARLLPKNRFASLQVAAMNAHCREVAAQIQAGAFDLLFGNTCRFLGVAPMARFVSIPKVLYLQEPHRRLYESLPQSPWAAAADGHADLSSPRRARRFMADYFRVWNLRVAVREEIANAAAYDTILVNSYFSRESVLRGYGLNSRVCYLGVDLNLFSGTGESREDFVLGLGAFHNNKNVAFVIKALALLPQPRPRLVWIGNSASGDYLQEMEALARDCKVDFEPKVRIPDTELQSYLSRAAMLLYAPLLEPFGYAPLEANACGTPVVAVAEGGVRETISDGVNGLVVAPEPAAMAEGIARLRNDPALARQLGEQGRQLVADKWSLAASIDRLERYMEETRREARRS
jgi:glycosyltransferase involved in cell wall biosynthesis